jgi:hypothetical protein
MPLPALTSVQSGTGSGCGPSGTVGSFDALGGIVVEQIPFDGQARGMLESGYFLLDSPRRHNFRSARDETRNALAIDVSRSLWKIGLERLENAVQPTKRSRAQVCLAKERISR